MSKSSDTTMVAKNGQNEVFALPIPRVRHILLGDARTQKINDYLKRLKSDVKPIFTNKPDQDGPTPRGRVESYKVNDDASYDNLPVELRQFVSETVAEYVRNATEQQLAKFNSLDDYNKAIQALSASRVRASTSGVATLTAYLQYVANDILNNAIDNTIGKSGEHYMRTTKFRHLFMSLDNLEVAPLVLNLPSYKNALAELNNSKGKEPAAANLTPFPLGVATTDGADAGPAAAIDAAFANQLDAGVVAATEETPKHHAGPFTSFIHTMRVNLCQARCEEIIDAIVGKETEEWKQKRRVAPCPISCEARVREFVSDVLVELVAHILPMIDTLRVDVFHHKTIDGNEIRAVFKILMLNGGRDPANMNAFVDGLMVRWNEIKKEANTTAPTGQPVPPPAVEVPAATGEVAAAQKKNKAPSNAAAITPNGDAVAAAPTENAHADTPAATPKRGARGRAARAAKQ